MSWADDIRCLFCDGRLPLYRKITNGQFCNSAHRKAYWQEQERLAVERLHQTHDSLRAYRPQGSPEAILGNASLGDAGAETGPAGPKVEKRPWWLPQVNAGQVPMAKLLPNPLPAQPRWLSNDHLAGDLKPFAPPNSLRPPVNVHHGADCGFITAGTVDLEKIQARPAAVSPSQPLLLARSSGQVLSYPVIRLTVELAPPNAAIQERIEEPAPAEETPNAAGLVSMRLPMAAALERKSASPAPLTIATRNRLPLRSPEIPGTQVQSPGALAIPFPNALAGQSLTVSPAPVEVASRATLPVRDAAVAATNLVQAGKLAFSPKSAGSAPASAPGRLSVAELRPAASAPRMALAMQPVRPRLRLSDGCRYTVELREPGNLIVPSETKTAAVRPQVTLPEHAPKAMRATAGASQPGSSTEPQPAGLVRLARTTPSAGSNVEMKPALTLPQPPRTEPLRPASKLEPLDAKPVADVIAAAAPVIETIAEPAPTPASPESPSPEPAQESAPVMSPVMSKVPFWTHGIDFWNHAPRDLKILLFAIPVLIGLAVHPPLPKVRVSAGNGAQAAESSFQQKLNVQWTNVRQSVLDRAAIALDEDFRAGLDDWVSRGDAPTQWSFDANGFVRPGPLAIFRPSQNLVDYQMQFLGMIDKKAMSWVVRASDFENYYVIKLVVLKPGPLPRLGLVRYAVVNGKADSRADTVVPIDARTDTLYRINVEVKGDDFTVYMQGQLIDAWTEPRLRQGGVGFFTARGEESRLRWIQVTHQYDMLGKLCAYLAPYNIPSTSGSWQP